MARKPKYAGQQEKVGEFPILDTRAEMDMGGKPSFDGALEEMRDVAPSELLPEVARRLAERGSVDKFLGLLEYLIEYKTFLALSDKMQILTLRLYERIMEALAGQTLRFVSEADSQTSQDIAELEKQLMEKWKKERLQAEVKTRPSGS